MRVWLKWNTEVFLCCYKYSGIALRVNNTRPKSFQTFLLDLTVNCGLDKNQHPRLLERDTIRQTCRWQSLDKDNRIKWISSWYSFQSEGEHRMCPAKQQEPEDKCHESFTEQHSSLVVRKESEPLSLDNHEICAIPCLLLAAMPWISARTISGSSAETERAD